MNATEISKATEDYKNGEMNTTEFLELFGCKDVESISDTDQLPDENGFIIWDRKDWKKTEFEK